MAEPTPYRLAAWDYLKAGWSPIPFPLRTKYPPASGFTGAEGAYVTRVQVAEWVKVRGRANAGNLNFAPGNIGIRLPKTVVGIDVDAYDGKAGAATLTAAEKAWGKLPATWRSTSRADGVSGIRLFVVPEGLAWPGQLPFGKGIELIRWDHRYALVAPSVHPEGRSYVWVRPDGELASEEIPAPADLPLLPAAWIAGLTGGAAWVARGALSMSVDEIAAWVGARPGGKPCVGMAATVAATRTALREATDDGGAHEAALGGLWGVLRDARDGHTGLVDALRILQKAFFVAVRERRKEGVASAEWKRLVHSGVEKVAAEEREPETEDLCDALAKGWEQADAAGAGAVGVEYPRTDIGNAHRFVDAVGEDVRFLPETAAWVVWGGRRWEFDVGGVAVRRLGRSVVKGMAGEKDRYLQPKARSEFLSFVRASGNTGKLTAMISEASSWDGVSVPASYFDSDPGMIVCANGVLQLGSSGVEFRPVVRGDYCFLTTGVEYSPTAWSPLWSDFLTRFVPDMELRSWLQRLAGYSLFGENPLRALVALVGGTSTGKTTFVEAIRSALGDYAGGFNLSLFRDNQDERPRADLVEALPKRFLVAEEGSSEWKIHADQVKRITGGSAIRARRPFSPAYVERVPAFTPWFAGNEPPTIDGADLALYRRLFVVPFNETISLVDEIAESRTRLCTEGRPAVLAWLVDGWRMYCAEGLPISAAPLAALEAVSEFTASLSDFDVWLHSACEFGPEYVQQIGDLYQAYRVWSEESGSRASSLNGFGRLLSRRGYPRVRMRVGDREGDLKVWYRVGVRLNAGWAKRVGVSHGESK